MIDSMAGIYNYYCTMIDLTFLQLIILSAAFATILKIVEAVEGHSQAYVQSDSEMRYLVNGVRVRVKETLGSGSTSVSFTDVDDDNLHMYASPIRFEPAYLDFKEHPIGLPLTERVVVVNPSTDTSIHMLSISGSTTDFHCSFFLDKSIPPGGNTTFDVVFVGRQEGNIENTLFIHTSLGSFKYQVKAVGISNPAFLKPFMGITTPLNSSYSPTAHMHNHYSSTLQASATYSSVGDIHIEFPLDDSEMPRLWEIPSRLEVKGCFISSADSNKTLLVHVMANNSADCTGRPVEMDILTATGEHVPIEMIDFGVMRSQDSVKTLMLKFFNYGSKHLHIQNVIVTPVSNPIVVNFQPVKIAPEEINPTTVATITFDPAKAVHPKQYEGKIIVKSKNSQFKLTIPYQVTMLKGSLVYDEVKTQFYLGEQPNESVMKRNFSLTNTFNVSVVVYEYKLFSELSAFVTIKKFKPVLVEPGETVMLMEFEIDLINAFSTNSFIRLHTNLSHFDLPLTFYDGKMKKYVVPDLNETKLNVGTLSTQEKRDIYFVLINENPVEIFLKSFRSNLTKTFVELVGVARGNLSDVMQRQNFSGMSRSLIIESHHYIVFRVGVTAPNVEGVSYGQIAVKTPYEVIKLPLTFLTVKGSLSSDPILFDQAFPGKVSWKPLQIHSSFPSPMKVTSVESIPPDRRIYFDSWKSAESILKSGKKNYIGKIYFDPTRKCSPNCYTGLPVDSKDGQRWLEGLSIPPDISNIDHELYLTLWNRWHVINQQGKNSLNFSLQVDTSEIKGFRLHAQTNLHWPHLTSKQKIKFPLTQIGNTTIREFALENPSGLPVIAQVLLLPMYTSPSLIVDLLQPRLKSQILSSLIEESQDVFTLQDTEEFNPSANNPIPSYRKSIKEFFHVAPLNSSITLLLTPGMRVQIHLGFTPKDETLLSSLILIRNNLTVLDSLLIQGQGGYGQIKFGNKKPGSLAPLQFEILEKHLKDCFRTKHDDAPNFTVKRSFTARNFGDLPVYFHGFAVNQRPCEGFGFKILNCQGFVLQPNNSKKIDIAFTPDFTLSRIHRTLNIFSSMGPGGLVLNYTLLATIPPHLMMQCANMIPRPKWEKTLTLVLLCTLVSLMICVSLTAYMEGNRIFTIGFLPFLSTMGFQGSEDYEKEKVFDLKKLVTKDEEKAKPTENHKLNNHCQSKKRTTSSSDSCANLLNLKGKKLNNLSSDNKSRSERHASQEKEPCNNNSLHAKNMERESEHSMNNNKCVNRKQAKRLSFSDSSELGSGSNNKVQSLKGWSNLFQTSSFKKNLIDSVNLKSSNKTSVEMRANGFTITNTEPAVECSSDKGTKSKKMKLKSSDRQKSTEPKGCKAKTTEGEEESFSPTPDSLIADSECNNVKPAEQLHSTKKTSQRANKCNKIRAKDDKSPTKDSELREDDDDDDKDIDLGKRSKSSSKKTKTDSKHLCTDGIIRPNSLELPYKLKSFCGKDENDNKDISIGRSREAALKPKCKEMQPDFNFVCQSETDSKCRKPFDLAPWDQPSSLFRTEDSFSEVAVQTDMFSKMRGRSAMDCYMSCPKTNSYGYLRQTPTACFTIDSDSKKQTIKHPGTIGQRHNVHCAPKSATSDMNFLMPGTPETPKEVSLPPFFIDGLQQDSPVSKTIGYEKSRNPFSYSNSDQFSLKNLWDTPTVLQESQNENQWSNFGSDSGSSGSPWNMNFPEQPSTIWNEKSCDTIGGNSLVDGLFDPNHSPWDSCLATSSSMPGHCLSESVPTTLSPPMSSIGISHLSSSSAGLESKSIYEQEIRKKNSSSSGFDPFRTPLELWQPLRKSALPSEIKHNHNFSYFSNSDELA